MPTSGRSIVGLPAPGVNVATAPYTRPVTRSRCTALLAPVTFGCLLLALALLGAISSREAVAGQLAVAFAFVPSGLAVPGGWRRRAAEAALLPVAMVFVLVEGSDERRMATAPLLVLAALAATLAADRSLHQPRGAWLVAAHAGAVWSAATLGGAASGVLATALGLVVALALAAAAARRLGPGGGVLVGTLAGVVPMQGMAPLLLLLAAAGAAAAMVAPPYQDSLPGEAGWPAVVVPVALLLAALSPWGEGALGHLSVPGSVVALALALLVASRWLAPAMVGAAFLGTLLLLAPPPPPAAAPTVVLDAARVEGTLPVAVGPGYTLTVALANAALLPQGTPVAEVTTGTQRLSIRAGVETAEWAHQRPDLVGRVAHELPRRPFWRPSGSADGSLAWGVTGLVELQVPAGASPVVRRSVLLPPSVAVEVGAAPRGAGVGPGGFPLSLWWMAAGVVVALLQAAGRTGGTPGAWVPWALLAGSWLAVTCSVQPVARFAQGAAVEVGVAALVAAWLPSAWRWLAHRRRFLAAASLLVPLALATPVITAPLGDDTYHLLLLESLVADGDLAIANNIDTARNPNEGIYLPVAGKFVHSPMLAVLLAPAYALAGRGGAAMVMALVGAACLALAMRRGEQLGLPASRLGLVSLCLLLSYPLATFSTQLWTELPGALLALAAAVPLATPAVHRWVAAGFAVAATLLKTRLALVALPPAAAAWVGQRRRRFLLPLAVASVMAGLGWVLAAALVGDPLDPLGRRRLIDLVPSSPLHPLAVLGGLAFDAAGGLGPASPLLLAAVAGLGWVWRRGGPGERALLVGGVCTLLALLHHVEWRGGDSPPARYLVPLWGALALGAASLLARARRGGALVRVLLPPAVTVWSVGVTHPAWLVNVGNGGCWLGNLLATRFRVDALDLFPSFLRPSPSRWAVPALALVVALTTVMAARRHPALGRLLGRCAVAIWLALAGAAVVVMNLKADWRVELEDPQVTRRGGVEEPPPGAFSRFLVANGVRLRNGEAVEVPLRLRRGSRVVLEGWLDGETRQGAMFLVRWRDGVPLPVPVAGATPGGVALPLGDVEGKGTLALTLVAPAGGSAVLDRLVVRSR